MKPETDLVLGTRYRLLERLAGGGMGEVWTAHDEVLGRTVAVKLLREEYADDPSFLARFRGEARHTAALSHPGIAQVFDYGETPGEGGVRPFIVMELVPGEPLSAVLAREGALDPSRAMGIVAGTAAALHAAHEAGVVHRDVKPGNLLLRPDGQVKVTDFGIARAADAVPMTETGAVLGTAHYLSPEQAEGKPAGPASDIYALGIVAYEALAGRRPFTGDGPVAVALAHLRDAVPPLPASVPAATRDLVMRMLAKDPAQRPASAAVVAGEAAALAAAAGVAEVAGAGPGAAGVTAPLATAPVAAAAAYDVTRDAHDGGTRVLPTPAVPTGAPTGTATGATATARRPLRRALPAGLLAALLLLGGVVWAAQSGRDSGEGARGAATGTASPASSAARTPAVRTVRVDPADYIGRPAAAAVADLRELGLVPRTTVATAAGGAAGTVTKVDPFGTLPAGSSVTLTVARAAPAPERPADEADEKAAEEKDQRAPRGGKNGGGDGKKGKNGDND